MISLFRALILLAGFSSWASTALAEQSATATSPAVEASLIVAEDGVAPGATYLSAGLQLILNDGWKTYWRSPGEVGLPPEIDWSGSLNVANVELQYPAPHRFRAFGIENFGYKNAVTFPIRIALSDSGQPVLLDAKVSLLICSAVCVPTELKLTLKLPAGRGIDRVSAAKIASWAARVPVDAAAGGIGTSKAFVTADAAALTIEITRAGGWTKPDVFAEYGANSAFGPPDIRLSDDGTRLWARLPILSLGDVPKSLWLTVTDGDLAVTVKDVPLGLAEPAPPYRMEAPSRSLAVLASMFVVAFLGGLVLNAMPCVLPVLSIKLTSAMKHSDRAPAQVRTGFLMTALGTLTFMWFLAAIILLMQAMGYAVGWGVQFQNPYFLIGLLFVLGLFAANLFGAFEIALPSGTMTRLVNAGGRGYVGDIATGAFAALLATPCSAPLLGTALAFALSGSPSDVVLIFTAMGLGLALPYLAAAAWPGMIRALPRSGSWMTGVKIILGLLLTTTAAWIVWVLAGVSSLLLACIVVALVFAAIVAIWQSYRLTVTVSGLTLILTAILALAMPLVLVPDVRAPVSSGTVAWTAFDRAAIPRLVAEGQVVFLDITADWCLTCKANKALVIDRPPVVKRLSGPDVTPMQGDWTRPDATIQAFLESHNRFGIPFNMVFGPAAPEGIVLPEILTTDAVLMAINTASGQIVAVQQ